ESEEIKTVADWIAARAKEGVLPHEFGVFVRSPVQLDRARAAVKEAGMAFKILDEHVETTSGHVSISSLVSPRLVHHRQCEPTRRGASEGWCMAGAVNTIGQSKRGGGDRSSRPAQLEARENEQKALSLWIKGATYQQI